ncbi:hypothetical protein CEXT_228441 [Caerostris extrusa]|uniref:Uncharacterized protein n=1 Tax=Caerostris extrusa TaxID=172846 RepID=A0AAV4QEP7_CAEEX|nr:hypothetical protein CEXT_228441 [Caerostris extrusa]
MKNFDRGLLDPKLPNFINWRPIVMTDGISPLPNGTRPKLPSTLYLRSRHRRRAILVDKFLQGDLPAVLRGPEHCLLVVLSGKLLNFCDLPRLKYI